MTNASILLQREIVFYVNKKWEYVESVDIVKKEDLDLVNHLSGKTQKYLKISFKNMQDLMACKLELMPIVKKNKAEKTTQDAYEGWYNQGDLIDKQNTEQSYFHKIVDIREYDVPYHIRC